LIFAHSRRVKIDDYYKCIYSCDLVEHYDSVAVVEFPNNGTHMKPVSSKENIIYADSVLIRENIELMLLMKLCVKKYNKMLDEVEAQLSGPLSELEKAYGVSLNRKEISKHAIDVSVKAKCDIQYFRKLLKKINPKVIIEVVSYSRKNMAMNTVAREYGIPTIELQHGVMLKDHIACQYLVDGIVEQLPQYFFSFSEALGKLIHFPEKSVKVIETGFPHFYKQAQKYRDLDCKSDAEKKTILFISQKTIGKYLSQFAVEFAEKHLNYRVIYKLHPGEWLNWKIECPWLLNCSNIEVIAQDPRNLYELFAMSDFQIGVYSTAIFEGMGFGLETFVYRVPYSEYMQDVVESGYASYVSDANELEMLMSQKSGSTVDSSIMGPKNATEIMFTKIQQIEENKNED